MLLFQAYSVHFFVHILIPRIPRPWASGDPLPGRGTYQGHSIAVPNVWWPSAVTSGSPGSAAGPQWRCASEAPGGGIPSPSRAQEPNIIKKSRFSKITIFSKRLPHRSYASPGLLGGSGTPPRASGGPHAPPARHSVTLQAAQTEEAQS